MQKEERVLKTDSEIARTKPIMPITDIAEKLNLLTEEVELYGQLKAKVKTSALNRLQNRQDGKLVLVTSINPTSAGEGKTTVTIGLGDALNALGKQTVIALREPSLGPVMGTKGGATGGGYSQVAPMDDINLHFTGDMHAITTANNTLSALIDNHLYQGNELQIDPRRVIWKRVLDINDRSLRQTTIGLGGLKQGVPREEQFEITVASEIMAVICLAKNLGDLTNRLSNIIIGYTFQNEPVTVGDLKAEGVLTLLLKEALNPNLVQTLYQTPAFIHGGPFGNIAHGCNSVIATKMALKLGDFVVTEAGFGADLGAEKFLDIKVPILEKAPDAIVIVATIRALKMHGGVSHDELTIENPKALRAGVSNLEKHVQNMQKYGLPVIVAVNQFISDTDKELALLTRLCEEMGAIVEVTSSWADGYQGSLALGKKVVAIIEEETSDFEVVYSFGMTIEEKAETIVKELYGGDGVIFTEKAKEQIAIFKKYGWDRLPICMAKTQFSLSDDPTKIGRPTGFTVLIRELVPKMGAGFIVAFTGDIMTMPGLPKEPAALRMSVDSHGKSKGLF